MKILRKIKNFYLYCGIEKEEYNAIKKDAYISNFKVWQILHFLMAAIFGLLFFISFINDLIGTNTWYYLGAFIYSVVVIITFMKLKKDSIIAQLLIYLSMSLLFLFAILVNMNKANYNATTFIVLLVIAPMFMIDKPYFMTIELSVASAVFLIWSHGIKPDDVWYVDMASAITFTIVGSFLNIISNALRIREFVLTKRIRLQKDTDEMTGLKNKGSLTREINEYLADPLTNKGILMILDIDRFKYVNDSYGHDIGDSVIIQLGHVIALKFTSDEIVGRFGGDEFILFIKNTDDTNVANKVASELVSAISESVELPNKDERLSISIGIALYKGSEKNYSELFKKADEALYQTKGNLSERFSIYK